LENNILIMPKISIITPTHNGSKYLPELWETIKKQTFQDFEWIIIKNNGGIVNFDEPKAKIFEIENPDKSIGRVKRFACEQVKGEIIVEIDHDDLITSDCLEEIVKAFEDEKVSQIYSDFAEFYYDHPKIKDWEPNMYGATYGWRYEDGEYEGHRIKICKCFEPVPSSFVMIWWAPNHIRAWRTKHYWAVGGHNPELPAVDDFDLELRIYLYGKMKRIPKCLYLYRITGQNSWIEKNAYIQKTAKEKADEYFYRIVYRWSELQKWKNLNIEEIPGDLNYRWPIEDNSIGILKAWDRLQLLKDPIHAMSEIYRILVPGGWLLSSTPSTDGRGAWTDPRNKSYWNENSFDYYIHRNQAKMINNNSIRFQEIRKKTFFPNQWYQDRNISYVLFDAIALKEGIPYRLPGWIDI